MNVKFLKHGTRYFVAPKNNNYKYLSLTEIACNYTDKYNYVNNLFSYI